MAQDQAKRQQKLMKKRQKDKLRKQHLAQVVPFDLLSAKKKVLQARRYPLYECRINPTWRIKGLATILVSRRQPDGNMAFGVYLVDIFCLGLKNTFCNADFIALRYRTEVVPRAFHGDGSESCSYELAHQIVYGAIDYAEQFSFKPQKDFRQSQYILEPPDSVPPATFSFGRKGKPFYISGPHDNPERILHQLQSTVGEGNYDYMCGAPGSGSIY